MYDFLFVILSLTAYISVLSNSVIQSQLDVYISAATHALQYDNYTECANHLKQALQIQPNDGNLNQWIGSIYLKLNNLDQGIYHLQHALELCEWNNPIIIANYIEALRMQGNLTLAHTIGYQMKDKFIKDDAYSALIYNLAFVEGDLFHYNESYKLLKEVISISPTVSLNYYKNIIDMLMQIFHDYEQANTYTLQGIQYFPNEPSLYYIYGLINHQLNQLLIALKAFQQVVELDSTHYYGKTHLAAIYQSLGLADQALYWYNQAMPFHSYDSTVRNNYGALLGTMNRPEEEVKWLKEALVIEPTLSHALINLAGYYQDEGLLYETAQYLIQAIHNNYYPNNLKLRISIMMEPVVDSWTSMITRRLEIERNLQLFITEINSLQRTFQKTKVRSALDRVHFYLVYHGLNDRYIQEMICYCYHHILSDVGHIHPSLYNAYNISLEALYDSISDNPIRKELDVLPKYYIHQLLLQQENRYNNMYLSASSSSSSNIYNIVSDIKSNNLLHSLISIKRRIKIGFMSKFFGIFEPHGLLLEGLMKYLPRSYYEVYILPVARTDMKPLSPSIESVADQIIHISLSSEYSAARIMELGLDILLFADTLSEPLAHFLAQSRYATIQMAFWGNPITSGSPHMDYFLSADILEHPHRTRMSLEDDPYSEQVLLIGGQGIWYNHPESMEIALNKTSMKGKLEPNRNYTRQDFNLQDEWFLYFCPQSVFKIHPLYDNVFLQILQQQPRGHIVITGGRRKRWTEIYTKRLNNLFGTTQYQSRLHIINRVSSEKFLALLQIADVVLHPFPFDGSRTSADSLIAGIPYVTLPSEYLRGRMGMTFLRTMNIPELVAHNMSEYINIAVTLGNNQSLYTNIKQRIHNNLHLIWEDMETIYEYTQVITRICGLPALSWEQFILLTSDRDLIHETTLRNLRQKNQQIYDNKWGHEEYLIDSDGVARLETHLYTHMKPKIFNNWKSEMCNGQASRGLNTIDYSFTITNTSKGHDGREDDELIVSYKQQCYHQYSISLSLHQIEDSYIIRYYMNNTLQYDIKNTSIPLDKTLDDHIENDKEDNIGIVSNDANDIMNQETDTGTSGPVKDQASSSSASSNSSSNSETDPILSRFFNQFSFFLQQHKYHDAYTYSTEFRYTNPQYRSHIKVLFETAGCLYFLGNYQESYRLCKEVIALDNTHILAYVCLGVNAVYLGLSDEAIQAYTKAIDLYNIQILQDWDIFISSNTNIRHKDGSIPPISDKYEENELKRTFIFDKYHDSNYIKTLYDSAVFTITLDTLQSNLLTALKSAQQMKQCVMIGLEWMNLPPITRGGAPIILFSMINWTSTRIEDICQYQKTLEKNHRYDPYYTTKYIEQKTNFGESTIMISTSSGSCINDTQSNSLLYHIQRIQQEYPHLLNTMIECIMQYMSQPDSHSQSQSHFKSHSHSQSHSQSDPNSDNIDSKTRENVRVNIIKEEMNYSEENQRLLSDIMQLILYSEPIPHSKTYISLQQWSNYINNLSMSAVINLEQRRLYQQNGIVLILQFYTSTHPQIQADMYTVLQKNLENSYISEIILLTENDDLYKFETLPNKWKLKLYNLNKRLTFQDAFLYANQYLIGKTVILANADIYFDDTLVNLGNISSLFMNHTMIALLKWMDSKDSLYLSLRTDSQDAWIFQPPITDDVITATNFYMGVPRCDNRLAAILFQYGYTVYNTPFALHAIEIQNTPRNDLYLYSMKNAVSGEGRDILLSDLHVFQ